MTENLYLLIGIYGFLHLLFMFSIATSISKISAGVEQQVRALYKIKSKIRDFQEVKE